MIKQDDLFLPTESVQELLSAYSFVGALAFQGVLLRKKNTKFIRIALLPVIGVLSVRYATRYTTTCTMMDLILFGVIGSFGIMKGIEWAFCSPKDYEWKGDPKDLTDIEWVYYLIITLRGIDWSWGVPKERLPPCLPTKISPFIWTAIKHIAFWHIVVVISMVPLINMQNYGNGTIQDYLKNYGIQEFPGFDAFAQLFQAICLGQACFGGIEYASTLWTLIVCLFQTLLTQFNLVQPFDATRWPPLFNDPWQLTSLNDLWSRRWHALFFRQFVALGLQPGRALFRWTGRKPSLAFGLMAAFLVSGLMHEFGFYAALRHLEGYEFDYRFTTTRFFLLQALGILLEQVYTATTGFRVKGWLGRIWGIAFLFSTATVQVTEWMNAGLGAGLPATTEWQLARYFVPLAPLLPRRVLTR